MNQPAPVDQRPKVGIGVVIRKDGKVLMGLRKSTHANGTWCCPGGHLEYGESFEACALREVAEECGVKISTPFFASIVNDIFPDGKHYVSLFMVADYVSGTASLLEPDKFERWEWLDWNNLPENVMTSYINAKKIGFDPFAVKALAAA